MLSVLRRKTIRRILKAFSLLLAVVIVILGCVLLFVAFYPFPEAQLLTKKHYPHFTTLRSGKSGDPVNGMILGTRTEILSDFKKAGWKIPDAITAETTAKIAADSIANLPYPKAPVSSLYLYHRKQDMAFEMPTNDVQNRGHIRLWDTHTKIDNEEVWLGSASYDHGIELSGTTHLPTHHIAPAVDGERNRVTQDLKPYMASAFDAQFTQPMLFRTNGGGDWYYTDGMMAVLSVHKLPTNGMKPNSAAIAIKQQILKLASPILNLF